MEGGDLDFPELKALLRCWAPGKVEVEVRWRVEYSHMACRYVWVLVKYLSV